MPRPTVITAAASAVHRTDRRPRSSIDFDQGDSAEPVVSARRGTGAVAAAPAAVTAEVMTSSR